jgi:HNH endonuclease
MSMPRCSGTRTEAALRGPASSTTAMRSIPRLRDGSPTTPARSESWNATGGPCRWGAAPAACPRHCGGRSITAIAAVAFRAAASGRFLDAHHIDHWARGGPTELSNLVQLCRYHHRLVHEGGYTLERSAAAGLRFRRPDRRPTRPSPAARGATPARSSAAARDNGCRSAQHLRPPVVGDRLDLPLTIDCLVSRDPRMSDDGPQAAAWPAPGPRRDELGTPRSVALLIGAGSWERTLK